MNTFFLNRKITYNHDAQTGFEVASYGRSYARNIPNNNILLYM